MAFSRFIDRFVSRTHFGDDLDAYRRARRIVVTAMMGIPLYSGLLLFNRLAFRSNTQTTLIALAMALVALAPLVLRATHSSLAAGHWMAAVVYSTAFGLCLSQGGFLLHILMWLLLAPPAFAHEGHPRSGIAWAILNVALATLLYGLQHAGMTIAVLEPHHLNQLVNYTGVQIVILALALWFRHTSNQLALQKIALERRLERARRYESIGRLAGGVAHGFNNTLTVVLTYARLLRFEMDPGDPRSDDLKEIEDAAHEGSGLARKLLAFTQHEGIDRAVIDLREVVEDTIALVSRIKPQHIDLKLDFSDAVPLTVRANKSRSAQILLTLTNNAIEAMPEGGLLSIKTDTVAFDAPHHLPHSIIPASRYALVSVQDTGVGMDEAVIEHLFEPFFTTKDQTSTGLSLATAHSTLTRLGGHIGVSSTPDLGTRFDLYLPLIEAAPAPEPSNLHSSDGLKATILIVEDEPVVLKAVKRILDRADHTVLTATRGEEALDLHESHKESIDLLLTDMIMPGISGRELAETLRTQRPDLPIIFMSGYTGEHLDIDALDPNLDRFVQKPFTEGELTTAIAALLALAKG